MKNTKETALTLFICLRIKEYHLFIDVITIGVEKFTKETFYGILCYVPTHNNMSES